MHVQVESKRATFFNEHLLNNSVQTSMIKTKKETLGDENGKIKHNLKENKDGK